MNSIKERMDSVTAFYIVIDAISILLNLTICGILFIRWNLLSCSFVSLLFHFHLAVLAQCIITLPYLSAQISTSACEANRFINGYLLIQIAACVFFLIEKHCRLFDSTTVIVASKQWILMHSLITTVPLIALLVLIPDGSFKNTLSDDGEDETWCLLNYNDRPFQIGFFVYLAVAFYLFRGFYYLIQLKNKTYNAQDGFDFSLLRRIMQNSGWYLILYAVSFFPYFLQLCMYPVTLDPFSFTFPYVCVSLAYAMLFFVNQTGLRNLEKVFSMNSNTTHFSRDSALEIMTEIASRESESFSIPSLQLSERADTSNSSNNPLHKSSV